MDASASTSSMDNRTTEPVPLTAIVLAGGQSSRMGQDKALIPIQGVPLLQRICHQALQCTAKVCVVTPWPERYRGVVPSSCTLIRETPWPGNALPVSHGPLLGFVQGLAQVQTDWVLLLACDLPRLRVEVLQVWIQRVVETEANPSTSQTIAFLPRRAKGWEPLCGFYHRSCLAALIHFINQGGRSFQRWLAQSPVQELSLPDRQMLFNCNTPEDLAVLLQL